MCVCVCVCVCLCVHGVLEVALLCTHVLSNLYCMDIILAHHLCILTGFPHLIFARCPVFSIGACLLQFGLARYARRLDLLPQYGHFVVVRSIPDNSLDQRNRLVL